MLKAEGVFRMKNREARAVGHLQDRLAVEDGCSVPDLARIIAGENERSRSMEAWMTRNGGRIAHRLAEATDSVYEQGDRRRPGRFVTGG